ncbi:MAG: hypothetical protein ACKVS9_19175 [Phycisphaerae bacterium]
MKFEELTFREQIWYRELWTTERSNYLLLRARFGYSVYHWPRRSMRIIEDDEIKAYVTQQMLAAGVPVLDTIPAVWPPEKPDSAAPNGMRSG